MKNFLLALLVLIGGLMAGYLGAELRSFVSSRNHDTTKNFSSLWNANENQQHRQQQIRGDLPSFQNSASIATPGVVHIQTYGSANGSSPYNKMWEQMFKEFFGPNLPKRSPNNTQEGLISSGSGVVISPDGYIVTNNHVIDNGTKFIIIFNDRREFQATLVGTDPTTDLAVLKIEASNLPFLRAGNSDNVQIGDWVLAVGNPFDLTSTVTAGIISAKGRNINILRRADGMSIESFIQTDAAVNPGNSGGALVNLNGEWIGINTAIASSTGSYAGYAFAIPSNLAKKVVTDLIEFGTVQRALLGIQIAEISVEKAKELGMDIPQGVLVAGVGPGSAAEEAGIKEGDVILGINDTLLSSSAELQEWVGRKRPGDKVRVNLLRSENKVNVDLVLKNKMGTTDVVAQNSSKIELNNLGIQIENISEEEQTKIGHKGVKITSVGPGKFKNSQVPSGFIVISIDKVLIENTDDFIQALENKSGAALVEGYHSDGSKGFYAVGL